MSSVDVRGRVGQLRRKRATASGANTAINAADQARAYRENAQEERERRQEIEANASGAFEAGKAQAEAQATFMLELVRDTISQVQAARDETKEELRAAQDRAAKAEQSVLEKRLDSIESRYQSDIKQRDTQISELRTAHQKASDDYKGLVEAILKGDDAHPMVHHLLPHARFFGVLIPRPRRKRWHVGRLTRRAHPEQIGHDPPAACDR